MKMFRQVVAVLVLIRLGVSLALILLEGASGLLQAASFTIALIGIAPVALLITGMRSVGRTGLDGRQRRGPAGRGAVKIPVSVTTAETRTTELRLEAEV